MTRLAGLLASPQAEPPSTVGELRDVLISYEANRPRSMQRELGPSELGTPCQQQIARKLAGAPRRPITAPTWAPFQGTAVHACMEEVVAFWNQQVGRERWLAEDRLIVTPGAANTDGRPDFPAVAGNGDAFDVDHAMVVDWKHVGKTALEKLQRAKRSSKPPAEQVSAEYRTQAHLYGLGHVMKGREVRWVRLVLLARDYDYDKSDEWTEAYDDEIAFTAIGRYWDVFNLVHDLGGPQIGALITTIPSSPGKDTCKWCPFYTPGQVTGWDGCAGDRPPETHIARATAGLIDSGPAPAGSVMETALF